MSLASFLLAGPLPSDWRGGEHARDDHEVALEEDMSWRQLGNSTSTRLSQRRRKAQMLLPERGKTAGEPSSCCVCKIMADLLLRDCMLTNQKAC